MRIYLFLYKSNEKRGILKAKETEKKVSEVKNTAFAIDEIREYKKLLDEGIISQEEFEIKKKQLLNL